MVHAAVILSGCGVYDGSEIHEAVAVLFHLSRHGVRVQCFAPDKPQSDVVNHAAGKPVAGEKRNVLQEAARIARGRIQPLSQLNASDFDAAFFPGGFGAAKNLSDFAAKGADCQADPDVARVIREFNAAGKPIGLCCISPILAARVLGTVGAGEGGGGPGVSVTIGNDPQTAAAIHAMGATHVAKPVSEAHVDERRRVVTAPAYMYGEAPIHEVFEGIGDMVEQTLAHVHGTQAVERTTRAGARA